MRMVDKGEHRILIATQDEFIHHMRACWHVYMGIREVMMLYIYLHPACLSVTLSLSCTLSGRAILGESYRMTHSYHPGGEYVNFYLVVLALLMFCLTPTNTE